MTPFALDQNLVLSAGAGTGKTYSLMTLSLHLLGGARQGGRVPPEKLCIVTFTEKAAAQLGERLRARVSALCVESQPPEPELRAAFEQLGQPFPAPAFWRSVLERLDRAQVGTFHGLCLRWLRPLVQRGLTDSSELLDEETASRLLQESVERAVLAALEAGDARVAQLCRDLGYSSSSWAGGLVESVARALLSAREEGRPLSEIPVGDETEARARLDAAVAQARGVVRSAGEADGPGKHRAVLGALEDALASVDVLAVDRLRGELGNANVVKPVKPALVELLQAHAAWCCAPLEGTVRGLVQDSAQRYADELKGRGLMDFAGLLERVRDGWRDSPEARRDAQARIGALLVDEFQDTNQVQLELVTLLAEQREGAPRPVAARDVGSLPLQPAFLAIVGDRKQSIYEFRGADVALFEGLAARLEQAGGVRAHLQKSYRATPPLVAFLNQGFAEWMGPVSEPRDYQVAFEEGDVLEAVRSPAPTEEAGVAVARLLEREDADTAHEDREAEARALAWELRRFLDTPGPDGRRPRGGEVAILLRRFSFLETYRQALLAAGVRHQVWRGRGFFTAPEVRDVEALLSLVCDPHDSLALVTLLRSPFVGLRDGSLWALAQACGGRLQPASVRALPAWPEELSREEGQSLSRFLSLEQRWRKARATLDPRTLLESALDGTGYRTAAALGPYGDTILANLERLLDRAARAAAKGQDVATLASELRTLMSSPSREPQAELQDGTDPDAVQLLTLHQSKGLEWPLVVVAELGAKRPPVNQRVVVERVAGLALRAGNGSVPGVVSTRFLALQQEIARRQDAEELRLFYVALTRARDRLWLSGLPSPRANPRTPPRGWAACAVGVQGASVASFCESIPRGEAPPAIVQASTDPPAPSAESLATVRTEVARVRGSRL